MCIDFNQLVEWRREFHRFPESGWTEFWTTSRIAEYLSRMGLEILCGTQMIHPDFVRGRQLELVNKGQQRAIDYGADRAWLAKMSGYTGCVAVFDSGKPGQTVVLRFDIDCVNVTETDKPTHKPNQFHFRSLNEGLMHACGHDAHIAIGLGVAAWLTQHKATLSGKVKLVFQPAEEGVRGAVAVANSGVIDDANYFISSHISFCADSGVLISNPQHFLSTTKLDIRYRGKPAHAGAQPHLGRNALLAAAHAVTQLHGIARHGEGMTRINVGVLQAGEGRNVIPRDAHIQLEVRGENKQINDYMVEQVDQIAKGVAMSFDVEYAVDIMGEAVDMQNDDMLVQLVEQVALQQPQIKHVHSLYPFNASEDATVLGRRVQSLGGQALYFILGADRTAGHHQAEFDFDESQLLTGVNIYTGLLTHLLGEKSHD